MASQLVVPLIEKTDRFGDTYYVGGLDLDVSVNLSNVSIFIFHGEEEKEGESSEGPKLVFRKKTPRRNFEPRD